MQLNNRSGFIWTVPPKVLIVEDDVICRKFSGKLLKFFGCSFDEVTDGAAAIRRMNSAKYDIVLMDIVMPNLDGISAASRIRQFDQWTPIISMTSNTSSNDCLNYLAHGMNGVLAKPFSKSALKAIIERYCAHLSFQQQQQKQMLMQQLQPRDPCSSPPENQAENQGSSDPRNESSEWNTSETSRYPELTDSSVHSLSPGTRNFINSLVLNVNRSGQTVSDSEIMGRSSESKLNGLVSGNSMNATATSQNQASLLNNSQNFNLNGLNSMPMDISSLLALSNYSTAINMNTQGTSQMAKAVESSLESSGLEAASVLHFISMNSGTVSPSSPASTSPISGEGRLDGTISTHGHKKLIDELESSDGMQSSCNNASNSYPVEFNTSPTSPRGNDSTNFPNDSSMYPIFPNMSLALTTSLINNNSTESKAKSPTSSTYGSEYISSAFAVSRDPSPKRLRVNNP
jgi:CheY-like chemotaxis protein